MRSSLITRGVSATAAVLLMTACSGSSDDDAASSATSAASSSAAESSSEAPASDSEFCTDASQINERITSLAQADSASLSDQLQTISDEIGAVEPPAEIADDWTTLADAFGQVAGALEGVDLTDPDQAAQAQAELGQLQTQLGDASTNVETYLREECGIDTQGTGTATDTAAPSS